MPFIVKPTDAGFRVFAISDDELVKLVDAGSVYCDHKGLWHLTDKPAKKKRSTKAGSSK